MPYGVAFLGDETIGSDIYEDTSSSKVIFSDNGASFWTTHEVDGDCHVMMTDVAPGCDFVLERAGALSFPSRIAAIEDAFGNIILTTALARSDFRIEFWYDAKHDGDRIVVLFIAL